MSNLEFELEVKKIQDNVTDDLDALLRVLPLEIAEAIRREGRAEELLEVVLDLGRVPEARFLDREVILVFEFLMAEQGLKTIITGMRQGLELRQMKIVQPDHEDIERRLRHDEIC